jgi:hypothetical protein
MHSTCIHKMLMGPRSVPRPLLGLRVLKGAPSAFAHADGAGDPALAGNKRVSVPTDGAGDPALPSDPALAGKPVEMETRSTRPVTRPG